MVAGFAHAPITKGILITVSIASVAVSLFQIKPFIHLQVYPHIAIYHHWYRPISQHFAFTNSSELFLALLLFYNVGVKVERTFGTFKFAAFLVVTTALYTVMQFVLLSATSFVLLQYGRGGGGGGGGGKPGQPVQRNWLVNGATPSGAWSPLFAILFQYHCIIPHLWSIRVGSLELTDKHIQTYPLALLLALSQPPSTLLVASLATLTSALYRSNSRLQRYRLPLRLYRVLSLLMTPWIGSTRLPQRSWRPEYPERRTLAQRQARMDVYNSAVMNAGTATGGGLGINRIASLIRRRTAQTPNSGQTPTQPPQPTPGGGGGAAVLALGGVDVNRGSVAGWNDVPPTSREELDRWHNAQVIAALHGRHPPAPDP